VAKDVVFDKNQVNLHNINNIELLQDYIRFTS